MECPQCGTKNEDTASICCQCGLDLDQYLQRPQAPAAMPTGPQPPTTLIGTPPSPPPGFVEYDPARRPLQPRPVSQFVPPPNFPNHRVWVISILWVLPTGIIALIFSLLVDAGLARGHARTAWRYSQLTRLWCWISTALGVAVFVGLFYWFLAWVRDFWPY